MKLQRQRLELLFNQIQACENLNKAQKLVLMQMLQRLWEIYY